MAATNSQPNQFSLTGFVAVDATIKSLNNSAVARFPMSLSRRENKGEEIVRKSSLITCEIWSKDSDSKRFSLLRKGQLIVINGFIKPEEYTDRSGVKRNSITFVCTSVAAPCTDMAAKTAMTVPTVPIAEAVPEVAPF